MHSETAAHKRTIRPVKLLLAFLLTVTCMPLIPGVTQEAEAAVGIGGADGLAAGVNLAGTPVYFGNYGGSPIKWYVVDDVEPGKVTLWTTTSIGSRVYDPSEHKSWSGSDICAWLNSTGAYSSTGFLSTAFSASEQTALTDYGTTESNSYVSDYSIAQKIVLPSVAEIGDGSSTGTWGIDYTGSVDNKRGFGGLWWLRSPGDIPVSAAVVDPGGYVGAGGGNVHGTYAVCPALKLDLESVLFTSAASAASGKNSVDVSGDLTEIEDITGAVKPTIADDVNYQLDVPDQTTRTAAPGSTVSIYYTGATINTPFGGGVGESVSMILEDGNGDQLYYARLSTADSGTATFTVPGNLAEGTYTVKLFNEQVNAENYTDYASTPIGVELVVDNTEPTVTSVNPAGTVTASPQSTVVVFDEAMDTTAGIGVVSVDNGIGTLPVGSWSESVTGGGFDTYTVNTSSKTFADATTYTFTISGFKDAAGNEMLEDTKHGFVTDFPISTYVIKASAGAGGSITPSGTVNVTANASQTFAITANDGYRIKDVLLDGVSVGAKSSYTFDNVTANHTIEASFEAVADPGPTPINNGSNTSGSAGGTTAKTGDTASIALVATLALGALAALGACRAQGGRKVVRARHRR